MLFFLNVLEGMNVSIAFCISVLNVVQISSRLSFNLTIFWNFTDKFSHAE